MSFRSRQLQQAGGAVQVRKAFAVVVAAMLVMASGPAAGAERKLAESNLALLDRTLREVALELIRSAPLEPGARIALASYGDRPIDRNVEEALLAALMTKNIETLSLTVAGEEMPGAAATVANSSDGDGDLDPDLAAAREARRKLLGLETETDPESDSLGDSWAVLPGEAEAETVQQSPGDHLPLLTFHVEEARIDYPRLYRSGVFGAQQVERRAIGRLSARLQRPESREVYWVGVSDTSLSDVVPRSDLKVLEDATRPETKGTIPVQTWTKIAEPVLVVTLVAGLVALFYTNRP